MRNPFKALVERRDLGALLEQQGFRPVGAVVGASGVLPPAPGTVEEACALDAVWACIRAISDAVSTLPLIVYRGGTLERAENTESWRLLHDRPHPLLTPAEWQSVIAAHLAGWGNAFLHKGLMDGQLALWPIHPSLVQVSVEQRRGALAVSYTVQSPAGSPLELGSQDLIHIRAFSLDGVLGLSPIGMHREALQGARAEQRWHTELMASSARPAGVISTSATLSPDAKRRLLEQWQSRFSGRPGQVAVLDGDVRYQPLAVSPEDAQFVQARTFTLQQIARIFRVPPSVIGAPSGDSLTYSTTETESLAFLQRCLLPYLRRIEQALNADPDVVRPGLRCEFLVDGLLRADARTRAETYKTYVDMGAMTIDEVRQRENLPPLGEKTQEVESGEA